MDIKSLLFGGSGKAYNIGFLGGILRTLRFTGSLAIVSAIAGLATGVFTAVTGAVWAALGLSDRGKHKTKESSTTAIQDGIQHLAAENTELMGVVAQQASFASQLGPRNAAGTWTERSSQPAALGNNVERT